MSRYYTTHDAKNLTNNSPASSTEPALVINAHNAQFSLSEKALDNLVTDIHNNLPRQNNNPPVTIEKDDLKKIIKASLVTRLTQSRRPMKRFENLIEPLDVLLEQPLELLSLHLQPQEWLSAVQLLSFSVAPNIVTGHHTSAGDTVLIGGALLICTPLYAIGIVANPVCQTAYFAEATVGTVGHGLSKIGHGLSRFGHFACAPCYTSKAEVEIPTKLCKSNIQPH